MKKLLYLTLVIFRITNVIYPLSYQDLNVYQETMTRKDVEKKLDFLIGDASLKDYMTITDKGLELFSAPNKKTSEFFLAFGTNKRTPKTQFVPNPEDPYNLTRLRVALDPGHLGGNMARIEDRLVSLNLTDTEKLEFDEGTLAVATAKQIAYTLQLMGAEVMLTHEEPGQSVYKDSFKTWCLKKFGITSHSDWENIDTQEKLLKFLGQEVDAFVSDSEKQAGKEQLMTLAQKSTLDRVLPLQQSLFRLCYNYLDLQARVNKINEFNPDLVLIIHYNAKGSGRVIAKPNYNLTFIPGNFMAGEFSRQQVRIEFIRLLVTPDLEDSLRLSKCIASKMESSLQVPLLNDPNYLKDNAKLVANGVYARGLALLTGGAHITGGTHAPVCYGETLIQNNYEEAQRLAEKSITIDNIKTSQRVVEVAIVYITGIIEFLREQK